MAERYAGRVAFFVVYIKEAHPEDGWVLATNREQEIAVVDPASEEERTGWPGRAPYSLEIRMPVLIDGIDNETARQYGGLARPAVPDRHRTGGSPSRATKGRPGSSRQELEHAIESALAHSRLPRVIGVDAESFLVIVSAAAVAAIISALVAPRLVLPVVVVELLLGIADRPAGRRPRPRRRANEVLLATSASGCCSSSPATRSTSSGSREGRSRSERAAGSFRSRSRTASPASSSPGTSSTPTSTRARRWRRRRSGR